jgi:hypothetical protein
MGVDVVYKELLKLLKKLFEYLPHKNLADKNALLFKIGPIKLELYDNFSHYLILSDSK